MRPLVWGLLLLIASLLMWRSCSGCASGCSWKLGSSPSTKKEQKKDDKGDKKADATAVKPTGDTLSVTLGSVEVGDLQFSVSGACTKTASCKLTVNLGTVQVIKGVATLPTIAVEPAVPLLSTICPGNEAKQDAFKAFLSDYVSQDAEIAAYARSAVWRALSAKVSSDTLIVKIANSETKKSDVIAAPTAPFEMLENFQI